MILPENTTIHGHTARPVVMRFVPFGTGVRLELLFDGEDQWKDAGMFGPEEFAVFCLADFETDLGNGVLARVTHAPPTE